jgi:osmotically-inducible protein OsmY
MRTDKEIRQDVVAELDWAPSIRDEDVAVAVREGVVTLAGTVDNYAQRYAAERAVTRVTGVKAIVNDLRVQLPTASTRSDPDLAHAALQTLQWHTEVPADRIVVKIVDGWLTLEGKVEWYYQRAAAETALRGLKGLKGLVNLITVAALPAASDVKSSIESTLKRQAELDAARIAVETSGQEVTLRGTVRSLAEKRDAERAAWNARGVSVVRNELAVEPLVTSLV